MTIMGKTFVLSDISSMKIDDTEVTDNTVSIDYSSTSAAVTVAGTGDEGIQCELDGETATPATDNEHTDEDTGNIWNGYGKTL